MVNSPCPEAVYGWHSPPNTSGNCVFCGAHISTRPRELPKHMRLPSDMREELLNRRYAPEQDPEVDPDPDDE